MDRRRGGGCERPKRVSVEDVAQSKADQHDARSVPEVAAPAPPPPQMSQLDIMMRFIQVVERIEMLLNGQATRG